MTELEYCGVFDLRNAVLWGAQATHVGVNKALPGGYYAVGGFGPGWAGVPYRDHWPVPQRDLARVANLPHTGEPIRRHAVYALLIVAFRGGAAPA